jgi:hypothetical protein
LHSATRNPRIPIVAVVIGLVLVACSPGTGTEAGADGDLSLSVTSPTDGPEVSVPFTVELESSVPLGAPETGNHHAHLYFDTDTSSEEYDLVYGTTAEVTRELAPGEHTIIASLRNADHSDAGPSQEFTVTVVEAGGEDAASPPPDDGGIDY